MERKGLVMPERAALPERRLSELAGVGSRAQMGGFGFSSEHGQFIHGNKKSVFPFSVFIQLVISKAFDLSLATAF